MKTCTRCLASKTEDLFGASRQSTSGLSSHCKACRAADSKRRRNVSRGTEPQSRPISRVPDIEPGTSWLEPLEERLAEREAAGDRVDPVMAKLLREIAHDLDTDDRSNPSIRLNLMSQWRASAKESGLSNGPSKPVAQVVEKPRLSVVDF